MDGAGRRLERGTIVGLLIVAVSAVIYWLAGRQFEARASLAYDLMDLYPAQLRQMDKAEYLDIKLREHRNQLRLQQKLALAGSKPTGP